MGLEEKNLCKAGIKSAKTKVFK